ncbi:hypothetical protein BS78_01G206400 [Paspalum vaginatum]|nr:hypothetical protein BS78_01G206400 [Paspalum vaginatum]
MKRSAVAMESPEEESDRYKIYVRMLKTVPLDVKCTDTIDQLKSKIGAIEGIDKSHQTLFFAGKHLENNTRLADYNIMTNSSVDLYVVDVMQIPVSIPSAGKTIKLDVKKSQSIADVKAAIEQKGGIPLNKQILMYGCQQLEDNKLVSQCGLSSDQTLHVLVCPTDRLHISVKVEGGRTVNLDVESWYTVADVKMMIETMEGVPAFKQILVQAQSGAGAELKDTKTLKSLRVENGEVLMSYQSIQLFIKTWEGKTLTMSVKMSGTVKDVMKKIEEKLPLKESIYYLHYRGRVLSSEDTLQKSKIGSNSTIDIRLRNDCLVS